MAQERLAEAEGLRQSARVEDPARGAVYPEGKREKMLERAAELREEAVAAALCGISARLAEVSR
jgi:hypothetical protein